MDLGTAGRRRCHRRAAAVHRAPAHRDPVPDPALADVPLQITDLSKKYAKSADRYAVRELGFRVEKGRCSVSWDPTGPARPPRCAC
ncbi:hypothetical protein NKH18_17460 [Streptomyces sp. M10(2022)]